MSTEEQRGYDKAVIVIDSGGNAQGCYDISVSVLNQNDFDKGWQRACLERGAKDDE